MHKPKTLWKYTSINRIDSTINGLVRFTQPGDLNDPFDANPEISQFFTKEKLQKKIKQTSRMEFDQFLSDGMKKHLIAPQALTEGFKNILFEKFQNGEFGISEALESIAPLIPAAFSQALDKKLGIFCLSATNNNILMWSHYGDQHKGIAIGYDSTHSYFNSDGQGLEFKIGAVKYRPKRPHKTNDFNDSYKIFYQKSPDWKYEEEWRIISTLKNSTQAIENQDGFTVHLFQIPIDAIQSVVFGMKTPYLIRLKTQIRVMEETLIDRLAVGAEPMKFYQAKKHPTLFKVNIEELSNDLC